MNKPGLYLIIPAVILLLAIIYEKLPASASDKPETYPEFETTSEVNGKYLSEQVDNKNINEFNEFIEKVSLLDESQSLFTITAKMSG